VQKNHLQVVSLLLNKANFKILDSLGNFPIDLTTDHNIIKLITKFEQPKIKFSNKKQEKTSKMK